MVALVVKLVAEPLRKYVPCTAAVQDAPVAQLELVIVGRTGVERETSPPQVIPFVVMFAICRS